MRARCPFVVTSPTLPHPRSGRARWLLAWPLFGLAACGSSAVGAASLGFDCQGNDAQVICLQNCNLGCSETGCARTDIAQNEIVILQFSQDVDPATVTPSSIRFRTASGEQPVGEFLVHGNQVEFVPTLAVSGGVTYFGFTAGETYTMTLPAGDASPTVVRSTSGKPFQKQLTCSLQVTRGIVDLNGVAPRAHLVSPTQAQLEAAPRDGEIVIEWNEMVDATPFLGGSQSPVTFAVRRTRATNNGGVECNPNSPLQTLQGTQVIDFDAGRGVSVLTFRPSQPLPGNLCIEVNVTDGVADLSGRPSQPQTFTFRTEPQDLVDDAFDETFDNAQWLDEDVSAATWGNGVARFHRIGGDGRHGAFALALATNTNVVVDGKRVFELNCDLTTVPASNTSTGNPIAVTDGRFFFTSMTLPSDVRLRFVGSRPPVFTVAGRCEILGDIDVSGLSQSGVPSVFVGTGQPGAAGGIFGGAGGRGGDRISNLNGTTIGAQPANQGQRGADVRLLAGHAYAAAAFGTGGAGSTVFPASGLSAQLFFGSTVGGAYCVSASAGGAGGGFVLPGANGRVVGNNHAAAPGLASVMGPAAAGGAALPWTPVVLAGLRPHEFYLVGGSGGGGAASQGCLALQFASQDKWAPGAGGGGGGGTFALRAGRQLRLGPAGRLLARGGSAADLVGPGAGPQPAPGGGGSGGSIVLQSGATVELLGTIDVRGGNGGTFSRQSSPVTPPVGASVQIAGGNGSPGFVRLETGLLVGLEALATMQPAATAGNLGALAERDDLVACTSRYRSTGEALGPEYVRYEIHGSADGVPFLLSDDPLVSSQSAGLGAPVRALFQTAQLDLTTGVPVVESPWLTGVRSSSLAEGIATYGYNAMRFRLLADQALAQELVIDRVVVAFRR